MPCVAIRASYFGIALCLSARGLVGQPTVAEIRGTVRIRPGMQAAAAATVELEGTSAITRTDSLGRFVLLRAPTGPQVLLVRRLGFAPARTAITVPRTGTLTVDVVIATSALQLDQLIVSADRSGRARGELGTATVIDRDAIANQVASSLQGILELVPGVQLTAPGLDNRAQFSLRAFPPLPSGAAGAVNGPSAGDIASSGTLIVLDGIPLSNNANLQSTGSRGEVVPVASSAGGGIDLRRIPATTLERVEVIRGVPSARWGDLTQGAIIVDTRAAATPPEFAARYDPRTTEGSMVGGRAFASDRQAITAAANFAQTASTRTLSSATSTRVAMQLAHRWRVGALLDTVTRAATREPPSRLLFDTRLDWWQLRFTSPERPDVEVGRNSFQDDYGVRLGERARLALGRGALEWTAAFDAQSQTTRESRLLGRPTTPFTDRLTEGRAIGRYVEGLYDAEYELLGAPRLLYSRLEWTPRVAPTQRAGAASFDLRVGSEVRREWNAGDGYRFAIDRPPQVSQFNGTAGFDRPRSFADVPPLATSALYADSRYSRRVLGVQSDVQAGVRFDALHEGGFTGGVRSSALQPRVNVQLAPQPWLRLRGGVGTVAKAPTVAQLSPARQFYDLVNVNRFTPDPRERLAVLTTFIRDPINPDLGLTRTAKREAGFELDGGAKWGSLSVTWFSDIVENVTTLRRDTESLDRARYALADTGRGTGQPGRTIDPPIAVEPVPIFLDRLVNGGRLENSGAEFTVILPVVPALRTRLEMSGATITSRFSTSDLNYGNALSLSDFQVDASIERRAYFAGSATRASRSIYTYRLVHHQPELGFVITATVQQRANESRQTLTRTDSLSFAGYLTRDGTLVPVPESERTQPQYADLRRQRSSSASSRTTVPNDWVMSLQIAKSLGQRGRLSFYVFNVLDRFATFGGTGSVRALPPTRFGAEFTLPTSEFFGRTR